MLDELIPAAPSILGSVGWWVRMELAHCLAFSRETCGRFLNLFLPQFSHLQNGRLTAAFPLLG